MRTIFYYRSEDPSIIEGKAQDNAESVAIQEAATKFAALFGAVPAYDISPTPVMVGVAFQKPARPKNPLLWTDIAKNDIRQFPLPKVKAPKLREPLAALQKLWNDNFPVDATKPRTSKLLAALGLSEEIVQGNALDYFYHGTTSWVACSMPLRGEKFTEVLASEFDLARHEWQVSQQELQQKVQDEGLAPMQVLPVAEEAANG
jgi:hypothetical protein